MLLSWTFKSLLQPTSLRTWLARRGVMDLCAVVSHLNAFAPPALAESWDNVGLLVEPSPPHMVQKLLLTNDLTEDVLEEAVGMGAEMVLSYHPPIFKALKRLTCGNWKERLMVKALEKRIAIYSPHTAYDALSNGVNDWLGRATGPCVSLPLRASSSLSYPGGNAHVLEFSCGLSESVLSRVKSLQGACLRTFQVSEEGENRTRVRLSCSQKALQQTLAILAEDPCVYRSVELLTLQKPPLLDTGMGRLCTLTEPVSLATALERIKTHVGLNHLRLGIGRGKTLESSVSTVAVCAGSGSSVLSGVPADLYLTGEMSHHDVLDAVAEGRSVVLCEHSNSERGYLKELRVQLEERLEGKVQVVVSQTDRDPLQVV
ncbi:NIF3-like protein 1 [Pelobates fuscus]|uniref:NIF3-like protein 1 n=1 Tax=Pelobates fuscus TaxID=191477 RepID=UPI002FE49FB0